MRSGLCNLPNLPPQPKGLGARLRGVLGHDALSLALSLHPRKRARRRMSTCGRSRSWGSCRRLCSSALRLQDTSTGQTCRRVCSGLAWMAGLEGGQGLAGRGDSPPLLSGSFQAASFGKCFLDRFPPDSFVRMCQDLRVLNAVRDYHIGIPSPIASILKCADRVFTSRGGKARGWRCHLKVLGKQDLPPSWILNSMKYRYKQLTIQVLLDRYSKPKGAGRRAVGGRTLQPLLCSCGHCL